MRMPGPLAAIAVLSGGLAAFEVAYAALDVVPSEMFNLLAEYSLPLAVVLWVAADARQRRRVPCHDFGWLVLVYYPVSVAWYLIRTRGWLRGVGMLLVLIVLLCLPNLCATIAWTLRGRLF